MEKKPYPETTWYISYDYESRSHCTNLGFGEYRGVTQEDAINALLDSLNKRGAGYRLTGIIACFTSEAIHSPASMSGSLSIALSLN